MSLDIHPRHLEAGKSGLVLAGTVKFCTVSSSRRNCRTANIPKYPSRCWLRRKSHQSRAHFERAVKRVKARETTDAWEAPESRVGNSVRPLSISKRFRLEQTMPQCLCGGMRGRCCNFSRDQEERASFEDPSATCHLSDNISVSLSAIVTMEND